jgi:hypothetical protein
MPTRLTVHCQQITADALDDGVLANTPRPPAAADIHAILLAC